MSGHPTAEEISKDYNFAGKTALVTGSIYFRPHAGYDVMLDHVALMLSFFFFFSGANTGIGKETARVLALRGCHVIMGCRSVERGEQARHEIIQGLEEARSGLLEVMKLDLNSLGGVRDFADAFAARKNTQGLHYVIANAGVMQQTRQQTVEGYEAHFGVNHLAHFLLVLLLIPHLKASAPSRVIIVSSDGHFVPAHVDVEDYNLKNLDQSNPDMPYLVSKLYNVLFSNELNRRLQGTGITCNSLHPGLIRTDIGRDMTPEEYANVNKTISERFNVPILDVHQGAATTLYAVGCPEGATQGGLYFKECSVVPSSEKSRDKALAGKLWELSENLTLVTFPERPV